MFDRLSQASLSSTTDLAKFQSVIKIIKWFFATEGQQFCNTVPLSFAGWSTWSPTVVPDCPYNCCRVGNMEPNSCARLSLKLLQGGPHGAQQMYHTVPLIVAGWATWSPTVVPHCPFICCRVGNMELQQLCHTVPLIGAVWATWSPTVVPYWPFNCCRVGNMEPNRCATLSL